MLNVVAPSSRPIIFEDIKMNLVGGQSFVQNKQSKNSKPEAHFFNKSLTLAPALVY
jgi:hypothetical protein